jgi:signal transduction histidine kinase
MNESEKIILALDDPHDLQLFSRVLTSANLPCLAANSIPELESLLRSQSPAMVVINQQYGGRDELTTTSFIKDLNPTIPVILLLKQESPETFKRAFHSGISDCLVAPLHVEEMLRVIKSSLQRARVVNDWFKREVKVTTASLQQKVSELKKLEAILENIEMGILLLDFEGRLLICNSSAGRTLGFDISQPLQGRLLEELLPVQEIKKMVQDAVGAGKLQREIRLAGGRVADIHCNPIPQIGLVMTVQDVTDIKQVDQLRDEFLHTVSHDLRSPLTAIIGYVDLLERVGPINQQQGEFISRIETSIQNISALVNDLLELGRIEAGVDLLMEGIPLDGIIGYELEPFSQQIAEKKLVLNLSLPTNLPPVRGNLLRLRQMLGNLVGNAVKYTQPGGMIGIEAEPSGNQVILRISDNGPGIPPVDLPHIFDKFYRASNVDRTVKGTGLGLAIVKSIVESHGGSIRVDSTIGSGSIFTVVLPAITPPEEPSLVR